MFIIVTAIWLFSPYDHIISNTCAEIKFAKDCIYLVLECISHNSQPKWYSGESKATKQSIKCGKKWNSLIKVNMVVSLSEVYNGKHLTLWKLVEYIIRGSIGEWFSGYGFIEIEGD